MDGASKFVKGDAIAAVMIVMINLVGGLSVGVLQQGMSFSEAVQHFSLLTVGEGLVAQIPALLISTATGIIVTRSVGESNLGQDLAKQLVSQPRALYLAGIVAVGLGLVPGLPKLPFFIIGGIILTVGDAAQARASRRRRSRPPTTRRPPSPPARRSPRTSRPCCRSTRSSWRSATA